MFPDSWTPKQRRAIEIIAFLLVVTGIAIAVFGIGVYIGFGLGGLVSVAYVAFDEERKKNQGT